MLHSKPRTKTRSSILYRSGLLAIGLGTGLPTMPTALAQQGTRTVVINHSDREALNAPDAVSLASNQFRVVGSSYQVRAVSNGQASLPATRPFFIFPLGSAGRGTVVSAKLRFEHPQISYVDSPDPTETMTFFSIDRFSNNELRAVQTPLRPGTSTPATPFSRADLDNLGAVFDDLGDGTIYGTLTSSAADNGTFQTATLNANARQAISAALAAGRSEFALGGDLTSRNTSSNPHPRGTQERIFRGADGSGSNPPAPTQLILEIRDGGAAPAPVLGGGLFGVAMLGTGLAGLGLGRRRRRA